MNPSDYFLSSFFFQFCQKTFILRAFSSPPLPHCLVFSDTLLNLDCPELTTHDLFRYGSMIWKPGLDYNTLWNFFLFYSCSLLRYMNRTGRSRSQEKKVTQLHMNWRNYSCERRLCQPLRIASQCFYLLYLHLQLLTKYFNLDVFFSSLPFLTLSTDLIHYVRVLTRYINALCLFTL